MNNKDIIQITNQTMTKYSSDVIQRGLDLATLMETTKLNFPQSAYLEQGISLYEQENFKRQGISIPIAFVLAAMLGTGFHLTEIAFPGVELFVSGSILLFGILLVMKNLPHTIVIATIAAIAGIFHGYAYGESIFGAEITPLLAYLIGFSSIQLAISLSAFWIGKNIIRQGVAESSSKFDRAGWVICGVGLAFFLSQLVALIFPVASS
jgi:urease accessory protein